MRILGFQKTTLLDYPQKIASTIFLGGCNFRCPFCHNAPLVTKPNETPAITPESLFTQLKKRVGIIEGICVTGGEPTLNRELPEFIAQIKELGYAVKLDTNGTNPTMLSKLITDHLIDYVSMDIKNAPDKYNITSGANVLFDCIQESITILMNNVIPYEFRTTVVRELHTANDFVKIGQWLQGANQYYLQNFVNSEQLICPNTFTSYNKEELIHFLSLIQPYIPNVFLRGID